MSLEGIAFFIVDKMSAYVVGGSSLQTAAKFTRGELEAIYNGDSWSRDSTGKFQKTPIPEALDLETAMKKAPLSKAGCQQTNTGLKKWNCL